MNWLKKNKVNLILVGIALVGMGLLVYPTFADWWNSFHQTRAVASYATAVSNMDAEKYEKMLKDARNYNTEMAQSGLRWNLTEEEEKKYNSVLDVTGTGIMGYINIPKVNVTLPIYHGTDEAVLQIAIGHLAGTSLPVGGETTHCVLSGHRGLPSARLFTDIDKLVEKDTFTINVLNETLTYQVDQIRVVEPTDLSDLQLEQGKDYCTLVTCTPYGINTHRLLVRRTRIANAQGESKVVADALQIEAIYVAPFVAVPLLAILLTLMLVSTRRNHKRGLMYDYQTIAEVDPDTALAYMLEEWSARIRSHLKRRKKRGTRHSGRVGKRSKDR